MLRELDHLPFRDSPDQVQMQTALPLLGLRISRGPRESVSDQRQSSDESSCRT